MEFGFGERGREGAAGLDGEPFSVFLISGRAGVHGRVWPVFSAGDAVLLLLMGLGVPVRGRNCPAGLDRGRFVVFGWRTVGPGDSDAMSK